MARVDFYKHSINVEIEAFVFSYGKIPELGPDKIGAVEREARMCHSCVHWRRDEDYYFRFTGRCMRRANRPWWRFWERRTPFKIAGEWCPSWVVDLTKFE
jgi:hypothetical protein